VVFDGLAEPGACVIAYKRFGFALIVRKDAVVTGIDRSVIESRTDFRSLTITGEMHDVSFAPEIALEDTAAQIFVDEIEQLGRAGMHADSPGLPSRRGHAFNASILDPAACQFHRQQGPDCAATDDQYRHFTCSRHPASPQRASREGRKQTYWKS